jgi:hypothetical protein
MATGFVYVLHFSRGYPRGDKAPVRHYVGWALDPAARLAAHTSPLVQAAKASGITITLGHVREGSRGDERRIKRQRHAERYCDTCKGNAAESDDRPA